MTVSLSLHPPVDGVRDAVAPRPTAPGRARLAGRTAVVTGGTTGIGFAAARRFLDEGARVLVTGQDAPRVDAAAAALGDGAHALRADVRDVGDLDALVARVTRLFGTPAPADASAAAARDGLDVLFANAGIGSFAPLDQVTEAYFDEQFDVNVRGLFFTVQRLAPLLRSGASIILNASAVTAKGVAGGSVYFATKAAVRSLARTLAAELAPRGIRVNALSCGLVPTPFVDKMGLPADVLSAFAARVTSATPLGRLGTPEEIADAAVFLASDESRYVTAQELLVDGGWASV